MFSAYYAASIAPLPIEILLLSRLEADSCVRYSLRLPIMLRFVSLASQESDAIQFARRAAPSNCLPYFSQLLGG